MFSKANRIHHPQFSYFYGEYKASKYGWFMIALLTLEETFSKALPSETKHDFLLLLRSPAIERRTYVSLSQMS